MRKIQLECIVFRKKDEFYEFLLLKRIPEKGGFWQPISGGLEESDGSLLDGAFRELKEEAGIKKTDVLAILPDVHYFEMNKHYLTGEDRPVVKEHVFGFEINTGFVISIDKNVYPEHDEFKWVSFEEALELLKWDNNKDAFKKLHTLLIKRK